MKTNYILAVEVEIPEEIAESFSFPSPEDVADLLDLIVREWTTENWAGTPEPWIVNSISTEWIGVA